MGDFFDDIGNRAKDRRTNSWAMQKQMIESGLKTPSVVNNNYGLTEAQIAEKQQLLSDSTRKANSGLMALPVGVIEGMLGIGGDVELLGQGIKGAWNAEEGQRWDGFVEGLSDRDTMFWSTLDNQERTDKWLEGTEFGDRIKEGSNGRLLGEILAPIPVPKGILQAGKVAGKAGMAVATHPMTRYAAETAKTETFNAINNISTTGPLNRGVSMFTPPKQNMVIGESSTKFDMPSYKEFKKQIDVEKVMESRKERNSLLPTKEEQKLWDLTAKKGNPTFIDVDGVIKQEIPTGQINLKAPLLNKPKNILENESLGSYGLDEKLSLFKMNDKQRRQFHGANAVIKGDEVGLNLNAYGDYLDPKSADRGRIDEFVAHEGQHGIQDAENALGNRWSTGGNLWDYQNEGLDAVLKKGNRSKKIIKDKIKEGNTTPNPNADKAIRRMDALEEMMENGMAAKKNNNYFLDPGEITARGTGSRQRYNKKDIADNHFLNTVNDEITRYNNHYINGKKIDSGYDGIPNPDILEAYKTGRARDGAVMDEYSKMLDDEVTKASSTNYKEFVHSEIKKMVKGKKGRKLKPNLKKGNFEYLGIDGSMGHGFEIHFKMDGKKYSVGSKAGTPKDMNWSLDNLMSNLDKHFDKGSPSYMNTALSKVTLRGEGLNPARTSYSMPNPDAKLFDDLSQDVIPKNRQNETTRLITSPNGTEIEKSLGYRGDPMLDSDWFDQFISSQTPTKDAIKYKPDNSLHNRGIAGPSKPLEDVPPMNNVLDANGGITKQPSTGLNSEAMSNMNPMEVARGRGIQGYKEIKEELRTLYKEAQGDPVMQKQIRDQIVAVDKQMNMFDADVAKPRKSIYEESSGFNDDDHTYWRTL